MVEFLRESKDYQGSQDVGLDRPLIIMSPEEAAYCYSALKIAYDLQQTRKNRSLISGEDEDIDFNDILIYI